MTIVGKSDLYKHLQNEMCNAFILQSFSAPTLYFLLEKNSTTPKGKRAETMNL